jgi:hypothetical protein
LEDIVTEGDVGVSVPFAHELRKVALGVTMIVIGLGLASCGGGDASGGASSATQAWWNYTGKSQLNILVKNSEVLQGDSNLTPTDQIEDICNTVNTDALDAASSPPPSVSLQPVWDELNDIITLAYECSSNASNHETVRDKTVQILKVESTIEKAASAQGLKLSELESTSVGRTTA